MNSDFLSFFIKAVVEGLKKAVLRINSRIEGEDFIRNHYYGHLGQKPVAGVVGKEAGRTLVCPVVEWATGQESSAEKLERDISGLRDKKRAKGKKEEIEGICKGGAVFIFRKIGGSRSFFKDPCTARDLNPTAEKRAFLGATRFRKRPIGRLRRQWRHSPRLIIWREATDHRRGDGEGKKNKEAGPRFLITVKTVALKTQKKKKKGKQVPNRISLKLQNFKAPMKERTQRPKLQKPVWSRFWCLEFGLLWKLGEPWSLELFPVDKFGTSSSFGSRVGGLCVACHPTRGRSSGKTPICRERTRTSGAPCLI